MLRTPKPIEIAEGALLADIAVVYQLLATYVPFIGGLFRFPIFIVLTILVLRRGLYIALMGSCVALFIAGILLGPSLILTFGIELLAGLYMGVAMRYRFPHILAILLGATCAAALLYLLLAVISFITGIPVTSYIHFLQQSFTLTLQFLNLLAQRLDALLHIGVVSFWQLHLSPLLVSLANLAFTYWWLTLFLLLWGFSLVSTFLIYLTTNVSVRLLGYEVSPFPGRLFTRFVQRGRRRIFRFSLKHHLLRRPHAEL